MIYNGKEVYTQETFSYQTIQIGDYVDSDVVMEAMDCLPPACMKMSCAQMGEPYSHRQDPDTGKWRPTFATFRCCKGNWREGVWRYCGHCFAGENTERGEDPVYA